MRFSIPTYLDKTVIIKQSECNFKGKNVEMCPLPSNSSTKDVKLAKKGINNQIWPYILSCNQMLSLIKWNH